MKKNKREVFLGILLICLVCVFAGCGEEYNGANFDKFTVGSSTITKTGGRYEITTTSNVRSYIKITDSSAKSYKLVQKEYDKDTGGLNKTHSYTCYSPKGTNPYEDLQALSLDRDYKLIYTFYSTKDCSGESLGEISENFYTYKGVIPSNETYIGVSQIKSKLGDWTYTNTSGGTEIACSSYGIADTKNNVPLCVALARVGANASDCADFLKTVYQKATGTRPSSIYGRGTELASYTSTTVKIPADLKDGDLITFHNGSNWAHIAMVFYWDAKGEWYAVNGGMSGKVKLYTLQETLKYSNTWTSYTYRSQ